ncbi:uncharacterized protein LOC132721343 [Ruditapes philippinarum]|uniref:uncharacterized protein LOC132721343 n=1 Tax=Ruditapes philippinarum TaxID=129788 RepID=UPI00295A96E2|nr:uncharacterized protein LOC132721343 [Ruditapes philippinarum]
MKSKPVESKTGRRGTDGQIQVSGQMKAKTGIERRQSTNNVGNTRSWLQEEMGNRKEVQTVEQKRQSVQMEKKIQKKLSKEVSRFNIKGQNVKEQRNLDAYIAKYPNLREDQVKSIFQSFSSLDDNGDGKISRQEIAKAYKLSGFDPDEDELKEIMMEHDENDDGYIDFDEYFHVMQTKMTEENIETEKLMESFKLLDVDNDGHITREEFAQALSVTGSKLTKKQIDDLVDRADSNKDGKIDFNGRIF